MSSTVSPYYLEEVFDKIVSKTDAKCRFAYPVDQLHHIIPDQHERGTPIYFNVIDLEGNPYLFRLTLRKAKGGYLKPEITGSGWKSFVRTKGIKQHDTLIFLKHHPVRKSHGVLFTVVVMRALTIFGQPQLPC